MKIYHKILSSPIIYILSVLLIFFNSEISTGQTTVTFTTSTYFTVPIGVTSVNVECWGAGGGGGGNAYTWYGGSGGGGGAYSLQNNIAVTPGGTYAVNVGIGGYGGGYGDAEAAGAGGDSWFYDVATILAKGGGPGYSPTGSGPSAAGAGGSAAAGVGTTKYTGGNGGTGRNNSLGTGGGGGSSAGTAANGLAGANGGATGGAGGIAPAGGGNGATGGNGACDCNGNPGFSPGGGGSGSGDAVTSYLYGGAGSNGMVRITYTCITITTQPSNQTLCNGGSADFKVVSGSPELTYQWMYLGSPVVNGTPAGAIYSGANSATLNISGPIAAGTYSPYTCVLTNTCGSLTSATAQLVVNASAAPATPANPTASALACNVTLTATGSAPGGQTWYWQGTDCGTNTGLGSGATFTASSTATYYIRSRDNALGCWSASCGSVAVSALDEPVIVTQPLSTTGCAGTAVSFSIVAIGAGMTYQWQENGVNLSNTGVYSGVTTENLTISNPAGLSGRTYRCIVSGFCAPAATSTAATLTVLGSGLSGIRTVGTAGNYANLRTAFADINTFGLSGDLYLQIISNITDNNDAVLNQSASCGNMGYRVYIYPTGAARTLSGSSASSLITLNGADRVIFNGKLDSTGAANSLIISNTNTSGSTIRLLADACYNTVKYCDLRGVQNTGAVGVVAFGAGTVTGNDNNLITNCAIHDGATTPAIAITATGIFGKENDNNTIANNEIYNFFLASADARGISIGGGNARWTISGNSIYQTVARTDGGFWGIFISNSRGSEFSITNNYIGGRAASCGGLAMSYNCSSIAGTFEGILISTGTNGISTISNNTIRNISFTSFPGTDGTSVFTTIDIYGGRTDVIGNTIGDAATGSINLTVNANSTYYAWNNGIYKSGDGNVMNNTIGSITINGTIADQCGFNAIEITGTLINDVVISGNTIGNSTTANSIQSTAGATPEVTIGGIYFGTSGNYNTTVSNNTMANINNRCTSNGAFFVGLYNQATNGNQTVIGNSIYNISAASTRTGDWSTVNLMSAMTGIASINSVNGGHFIAQNTIHSFNSTGAGAVQVYGIMCHHDGATGSTIAKNLIHSFSTTSNTATQVGIKAHVGIAIVNNNMIRLGYNASGVQIATSPKMIGIWQSSASACTYNYNSVYLGGADGTAGAINTYAFKRDAGSSTLANNIFYNARTGGGARHYAITTNSSTVTSNYNDLFSSVLANLGSYDGGTTARTFAAWQTGTSQDANSRSENPLFVNPTGSALLVDLHLAPGSPEIGRALANGVNSDIDNQMRKTGVGFPNGPTIGADEVITGAVGANAYGIYAPATLAGNVTDCEIYAVGGTPGGLGIRVGSPTDINYANVYIKLYHIITASNYSCMHTRMKFTTSDPTPFDWLLGNGAAPLTSSVNPVNDVTYSSVGRKSIIESIKVFKDFVNMTMDTPDEGSILGAPAGAGCPTTYSYTSSVAGSPGFTYYWTVNAPGGCSATIASPNTSTTDVTFVNQTGVNQVFVLTLQITTECCGPLERVIRYITIYPSPTAPTVSGTTFSLCTGGSQSVSVTGPDPTYSYEWYDASTGGSLLGTGTTFTINPVLSGTESYWVQATNSYGCASTRTEVQVTGNDTPSPTVSGASTCGTGDITLTVSSPSAGATYNWYSGSCGGTLLQTSTATSFTTNISATTTFYVEVIPVGCGASSCSSPIGTLISPPNPIVWLGAVGGVNNWFNAANWSSGCLPTCATNVQIPNLAIDPDIGFNATANAACQNIELQSGAILSFSDSKAELDICGNTIHAGVVSTGGLGLVKFMGSSAQTYTKTGSGDFHNVTLNNTAVTPSLTISSGDLILDASGVFEFQSGKVVTAANNLIIKNTDVASIIGHSTTNYVNGNLTRYVSSSGQYDLPLGNNNAYELGTINISSTSGLTYLNTNFSNPANATGSALPLIENTLYYDAILNCGGVNATTGNANGGIWTITPDAGTANYTMILQGRNWDNPGTGQIIVKRNTSGPGPWTLAGAAVSNTNVGGVITCERNTYSGFSQFAIARTRDVLPISLINFNAKCENASADVQWSTASEQNNDYFSLERSIDAASWELLATVQGAGNSNNIKKYQYTDDAPYQGISYYRLKQTDFDGAFKYFGPVSAQCDQGANSPSVAYYPNPFTQQIMVDISNLITNNATVSIFNILGEKIFDEAIADINENNHKFILDLKVLASGVYTIQFSSANFTQSSRIVKYY